MTTVALQNPSTGETEETFPRFDDADRDALLTRAVTAQREWRATPL